MQVDEPPEKLADKLVVCKLLKAKVVAEGRAVLSPEPGKVIIIFPPIGIADTVVNLIVCFANAEELAVETVSEIWVRLAAFAFGTKKPNKRNKITTDIISNRFLKPMVLHLLSRFCAGMSSNFS